MNAGESLPDQGVGNPPVRPRKLRSRGPKSPPVERREASASSVRKTRAAPRKRGIMVRLPALHSPHFISEAEKGNDGDARAAKQ